MTDRERVKAVFHAHMNGGSKFSEAHYRIEVDGKDTGFTRHIRTNGRPKYKTTHDEIHAGEETLDLMVEPDADPVELGRVGSGARAVADGGQVMTDRARELREATGEAMWTEYEGDLDPAKVLAAIVETLGVTDLHYENARMVAHNVCEADRRLMAETADALLTLLEASRND